MIRVAQAAASGPPWLAIILAVIALVSAVGVALAPALVEKVKSSRKPTEPATTPAAVTAAPVAAGAVDLTGDALRDAWSERDEAQARSRELTAQLDQARADIADLRVTDARKTARIETLEMLLGHLGKDRT